MFADSGEIVLLYTYVKTVGLSDNVKTVGLSDDAQINTSPADPDEDVEYEEVYKRRLDGVSRADMCRMLHGLKMISE